MQLANAPATGEVIHPHRRTKSTRNFFGDHAVLAEDGDHKWQNMHKM